MSFTILRRPYSSRREFLATTCGLAAASLAPGARGADLLGSNKSRGTFTCLEVHPYKKRPGAAAAPGAPAPKVKPQFFAQLKDKVDDKNKTREAHVGRLAIERDKTWQADRFITWRFVQDGPKSHREAVEQAFAEWQTHIHLEIRKVNSGNADILVGFNQSGFWSLVGKDSADAGFRSQYGGVTLNLDQNATHQSMAAVGLHEVGHALGAIHEHQSPEANIPWDVAALFAEYGGSPNFWSQEDVYYQIVNRYSHDLVNSTAFDRASIMLYPIAERHLKKIANWQQFVTGWNLKLSPLDIEFMQKHYGVASGATPSKPDPASTNGGEKPGVNGVTLKLGEKQNGEISRDDGYVDFVLEISEAGKYAIETVERDPATYVVLELYKVGGKNPEATDSLGGDALLNARIRMDLAAGKYVVRVKHRHRQGRGKFTIYAHAV